jgi:hypothetical protein
VVRPRSCRVIYYFDTPALGIRHQLFDRVSQQGLCALMNSGVTCGIIFDDDF